MCTGCCVGSVGAKEGEWGVGVVVVVVAGEEVRGREGSERWACLSGEGRRSVRYR